MYLGQGKYLLCPARAYLLCFRLFLNSVPLAGGTSLISQKRTVLVLSSTFWACHRPTPCSLCLPGWKAQLSWISLSLSFPDLWSDIISTSRIFSHWSLSYNTSVIATVYKVQSQKTWIFFKFYHQIASLVSPPN